MSPEVTFWGEGWGMIAVCSLAEIAMGFIIGGNDFSWISPFLSLQVDFSFLVPLMEQFLPQQTLSMMCTSWYFWSFHFTLPKIIYTCDIFRQWCLWILSFYSWRLSFWTMATKELFPVLIISLGWVSFDHDSRGQQTQETPSGARVTSDHGFQRSVVWEH